MRHNNIKGSLILCLTAFIWGLAFVAQSDGAQKVPPFLFNSLRSLIAAAVLFLFYKAKNREPFFPKERVEKRQLIKIALICGALFTVAANLQQIGFLYYPKGAASEARAGFLTALYVVIVPIFSLLFGKKLHPLLLVSVAVTVGGVALLCLSGGVNGFYAGDLFMLLCAFGFSAHIMAIDRFVAITGGVRLSILQFLTTGIFSGLLSLLLEKVQWQDLFSAAPQILYLGIVSSAIGYTLQIVGQKYAEPSVASLCMSLESVFAALAGWLISGNGLSLREGIGCALVFTAILIAQIPEMLQNKTIKNEG